MNPTTLTTIIGAVAAAVIAILQATNHSRIGDLEGDIVPRHEVSTHVDDLHTWQQTQDERIELLEQTLMDRPE